ncbi:MAG: DUF1611 domain-containing protein [bacterium]|nr:DUF1611 domain-containing protein [bacterium]
MNASPQLQQGTNSGCLRIAVIDTGVDEDQMNPGALAGAVTIRPTPDGGCAVDCEAGDPVGHGTAVVRAMADRTGLPVHSVGLADWTAAGSATQLARAITWCLESGIQVINISAGSTCPSVGSMLTPICARAAAAGVIIVAAEHNDGLVSYPAHLPSVIGVRGGRIHGDNTYHYCPGQPIECVARGDAQRLQWRQGKQVFVGGSSFAAPRITAIVAGLKRQHPEAGIDEIRALLRQGAAPLMDPAPASVTAWNWPAPPLPPIHRVALYPYTKEMHALVRFQDLVPFQVSGIADPPGRGQVGADAGQVIGAEHFGTPVCGRLAAAVEGAEALVLGYLRQLGTLRGRDLHRECLTLAIKNHLHVFSFEPLPAELYGDLLDAARAQGLRFSWPSVSIQQARQILAGRVAHGPVDRPVLGVFGTSASQGKFTLQLALRRRFLQQGYRIAQVGTEHHAALFGMDFVFPMGHGSTVAPDVSCYPELLDRVMRRICVERQPDLLMVGAQSGTVPFDRNDHRTLTLATLAFLLGTKPDACILVVNAIDPEGYIEDTIAGLRSVGQTEVIALAVSDRGKVFEERHGRSWTRQQPTGAAELAETLDHLEARFRLPAVQITSAAGVSRLCAAAVQHFSHNDGEEMPWKKSA